MSIEKLKSGHYRIRCSVGGKRISITTDRKPSKAEEAILIQEYIQSLKENGEEAKDKADRSFLYFAEEYIASKKNVLSASTIRGYNTDLKGIPESFKNLRFYSIEQHDITKVVNEMAGTVKPKTIYNRHGLITAVMKEFRPALVIRTKLPRKEQKDIYTPSEEEVKALFHYVETTPWAKRYYIPLSLAIMGLRRSEISALTLSDLSDENTITINKAKVINSDKEWIIQNYTKTERSNREIPIPDKLAEKIREQGYIYEGKPNSIYCAIDKIQKELKLPHFGIHRLRSYFASKAHALGMPDSVILSLGGWASDYVMKSVYRKALKEDIKEGTQAYIQHMDSLGDKTDSK